MTAGAGRPRPPFGSGHVRPVVVHYLNSVVSGLLAGSYREAVGRELFAAVARSVDIE